MNRIDLYLDALGHAFSKVGDNVPWPVHVAAIHPYFAGIEARDIYTKYIKIVSQDNPRDVFKKMLVRPSVTKSTLLMDLIIGMKVAKPPIPTNDRVGFVEFVYDVLDEVQHGGDIFCRNNKNLILTSQKAQELFEQTPWTWTKPQDNKITLAQQISAGSLALNWSLYFYGWPDVGLEIHGPYDVHGEKNEKFLLLIREFFDVKPILLWKSMESFPYTSIKIMTLYNSFTDLSIDIFNHLTHRSNLSHETRGLCVEANNYVLQTHEELIELKKIIIEKISKQNQIIQEMTREEIVIKFIESRYYALRNWRIYNNEDWYPPSSVFQRMKEKGLIHIPHSTMSWDLLRKAFDPRDEFVFR